MRLRFYPAFLLAGLFLITLDIFSSDLLVNLLLSISMPPALSYSKKIINCLNL